MSFLVLSLYLLSDVILDEIYWFIFSKVVKNKDFYGELTAEQLSAIWATGFEVIFVLLLIVGHKNNSIV